MLFFAEIAARSPRSIQIVRIGFSIVHFYGKINRPVRCFFEKLSSFLRRFRQTGCPSRRLTPTGLHKKGNGDKKTRHTQPLRPNMACFYCSVPSDSCSFRVIGLTRVSAHLPPAKLFFASCSGAHPPGMLSKVYVGKRGYSSRQARSSSIVSSKTFMALRTTSGEVRSMPASFSSLIG